MGASPLPSGQWPGFRLGADRGESDRLGLVNAGAGASARGLGRVHSATDTGSLAEDLIRGPPETMGRLMHHPQDFPVSNFFWLQRANLNPDQMGQSIARYSLGTDTSKYTER